MPELPEVECVRRTIEARVVGATIDAVTVHRRDVVCRHDEPRGGWSRLGKTPKPVRFTRIPKHELGAGAEIVGLHRRGKQLAVELAPAGALLVHLGMTGQLVSRRRGEALPKSDHVHVTWHLSQDLGRLVFRDPRRFGGIWLYPSITKLKQDRWDALGPDALEVDIEKLREALQRTSRPIKAALLDQSVLAGVGNIYADEALFQSGIHPTTPANMLPACNVDNLRTSLMSILQRAVDAGGSTVRDYANGDGKRGEAQQHHAVYGRAGEPCVTCSTTLQQATIAQRTTVWCEACQPMMRNS